MRPATIAASVLLSAMLLAGCASDDGDGDGDGEYQSRGYSFLVTGRTGGRQIIGPYNSRGECRSARALEERSGRWGLVGGCSRI